MDKLQKLKDNLGGDMPFMASCEVDIRHEMEVLVASIQEVHDCGPDGKWSGYRVEA